MSRRTRRPVSYNETEADDEFQRRMSELENEVKPKPARKRSPRISLDKDLAPLASYINHKDTPWNMIPSMPPSYRQDVVFSHMLYLETAVVDTSRHCLLDNDGTLLLSRNDTIYMVSEPPGEPYYIGRVVEFVIKEKFREIIKLSNTSATIFPAKYFNVKMNWFFRPRDIRERVGTVDPRMLYATLQQDECPITSYRGKCQVFHRDELEYRMQNVDQLYEKSNVFYYEELFDRYTLQYYKIFNTHKLLLGINPDSAYLKVLSKRYSFIYCEADFPLIKMMRKYICGETTDNPASHVDPWDHSCQVCRSWCSDSTSITCKACRVHVHMACMKSPLQKKPHPMSDKAIYCFFCNNTMKHTSRGVQNAMAQYNSSRLNQLAKKMSESELRYNKDNILFQYFGKEIILKFDDVLNDDLYLPFPIMTSRMGANYQWDGCNINTEKWVPNPYSDDDKNARGTDETITTIWNNLEADISDDEFHIYKNKCAVILRETANMDPSSCSFQDYILKTLYDNNCNASAAYEIASENLSRKALDEPDFSPEELRKFENAVKKYGSQLRPVWKQVRSQPLSMIVKYFYKWKKTHRGLEVRGKLEKKSKLAEVQKREKEYKVFGKVDTPVKIVKYLDDSSIETADVDLATNCFKCKFCSIEYSPMWYKVAGGTNDEGISDFLGNRKGNSRPGSKGGRRSKIGALCIRCARLWRRYAVKWSPPLVVLRDLVGDDESDFLLCIAQLLCNKEKDNFILNTSSAHKKFLENELVRDSELIVRQRAEAYVHPDELEAMKNKVMELHSQLYKRVISKIDKAIYDIPRMKLELEGYLRKFEELKTSMMNETKPLTNGETPVEPKLEDEKEITTKTEDIKIQSDISDLEKEKTDNDFENKVEEANDIKLNELNTNTETTTLETNLDTAADSFSNLENNNENIQSENMSVEEDNIKYISEATTGHSSETKIGDVNELREVKNDVNSEAATIPKTKGAEEDEQKDHHDVDKTKLENESRQGNGVQDVKSPSADINESALHNNDITKNAKVTDENLGTKRESATDLMGVTKKLKTERVSGQ